MYLICINRGRGRVAPEANVNTNQIHQLLRVLQLICIHIEWAYQRNLWEIAGELLLVLIYWQLSNRLWVAFDNDIHERWHTQGKYVFRPVMNIIIGRNPQPFWDCHYIRMAAGSHHICYPVYKYFLCLHHTCDIVGSFDTPTQYNTSFITLTFLYCCTRFFTFVLHCCHVRSNPSSASPLTTLDKLFDFEQPRHGGIGRCQLPTRQAKLWFPTGSKAPT